MPARPLLRSAVALLAACGSSPEPLLRGTVTYDAASPGDSLIIEVVRPTDGALVARRVYPAGSAFPLQIELGQGDLVPGGPPASAPLVAHAKLETLVAQTGQEPVASAPVVPGQPVVLALAERIPPPERPVYANTKGSRYDHGLLQGTVDYGAPSGGRALMLEVVSADGSLIERVAAPDPSFPHRATLRIDEVPPGSRLRGWLDADGDPTTRQPPEPQGEIPYAGASPFQLTLKDPG